MRPLLIVLRIIFCLARRRDCEISYDYDAAYEQHVFELEMEEMPDELRKEAIGDFVTERLQSHYLANAEVILPALAGYSKRRGCWAQPPTPGQRSSCLLLRSMRGRPRCGRMVWWAASGEVQVELELVRSLYAYNEWATERLVRATSTLEPGATSERVGAGYGSIREVLAHVLSAEVLWLRRWEPELADRPDPGHDLDMPALREKWEEHRATMEMFVRGLSAERLRSPVRYTTSSGRTYEQPLWQLMLQLVVHGTHHRSEIAEMLTRFGVPPPFLDYVAFTREASTG